MTLCHTIHGTDSCHHHQRSVGEYCVDHILLKPKILHRKKLHAIYPML